jgi:acyl-coenzyme A synthetase/AMP-(fatty) acid ligase
MTNAEKARIERSSVTMVNQPAITRRIALATIAEEVFRDQADKDYMAARSQRIQFVPELPKTATGKVKKYVLRGKPAISKQ